MTYGDDCAYPTDSKTHGLTKREYFTAMAMQGILAANNYIGAADAAENSVAYANALINELNKKP